MCQMCDDQMLNDTDDVFGGDTCAHCGATALESFDCALNGCRFGLLAEHSDGSTPAPEFEQMRYDIFKFWHRLCPEPLYAGYLWARADEISRENYSTDERTRPPQSPASKDE